MRLYWAPCCRGERAQTTGSLACLLPEPEEACSLHGVRVGVCPGFRPAGWLGWFAHPLGGDVCRGHAQYPAFLWALQKWQLDFLVSLYPLSRICPNSTYMKSFFSSVQSLSCVRLFATPWITALQASLSITNSRSLLKHMSIESVMPSSHLILFRPLLLLPPIPPRIRVFSNESALRMRWPKYWSFSFSISPSNEHPGLISFRMHWLDLLAVQGTLKSLLQHHSSKVIFSPIQFLCILLLEERCVQVQALQLCPKGPMSQACLGFSALAENQVTIVMWVYLWTLNPITCIYVYSFAVTRPSWLLQLCTEFWNWEVWDYQASFFQDCLG